MRAGCSLRHLAAAGNALRYSDGGDGQLRLRRDYDLCLIDGEHSYRGACVAARRKGGEALQLRER